MACQGSAPKWCHKAFKWICYHCGHGPSPKYLQSGMSVSSLISQSRGITMAVSVCSGKTPKTTVSPVQGTLHFLHQKASIWATLTHVSMATFMTSLVWLIFRSLPLWCATIQVKVQHEVQHVSKLTFGKEEGWETQMSIRYVSNDSLS